VYVLYISPPRSKQFLETRNAEIAHKIALRVLSICTCGKLRQKNYIK